MKVFVTGWHKWINLMRTLSSPKKFSPEAMLSKDMPYKVKEIIRDTWPNLFRPHKDWKPPSELKKKK
tara:strand:- start:5078 stop:5278 length:201 start_codon:yes stop_codon:yes gene_type:complete